MRFASPEWLLLLPILAVCAWVWRALQLHRPLRAIICVLLALTLAEPRLRMMEDALDLWVLLDRSNSTEDLVDRGLVEWQRLLERSKPSRHDRLKLVDYAAEVVEHGADGSRFTGSRKLTRTNLALQNVVAMAEDTRPSRVLVFTDGFATEPLDEAAEQLGARGIPLDFRLVREENFDDARVASVDIPPRMQSGEPFLLAVTVRGSRDGEVPLLIRRAGEVLAETSVKLVNGVGRIEFTDRIPRVGAYEYEAEIRPESDSHPGNNILSRWIEISGGPRVLLVSKYTDDPMADVLASLDFTVSVIDEPLTLKPGMLAGTRAVVFNNIPAFEVPPRFLDALDFFVREQAGGFLMVGGEQSFGSGGYFQSSIDPLLPVSMELKTEHRKLAVALAIVMDRSGSMSVNVGGAGPGVTKMDLANAGAANAIELLGMMDQVTVFAVDSEPHRIIPLTNVGDKKEKLIRRAKSVKSMGGGIFVYEGLKAAWDELRGSPVGTRHVILFSDAADSEEPGGYEKLLKTMLDNSCTVSVIGLGTRADTDAKLLEDIAKRGDGRIFFTDQPIDVPKIFAQETVTIARSAFVQEPIGGQATGRWAEISPKPLDWLPEVGGYNLSYAREDATTSLLTTDEYLAPLVSHARRGLGRTMAVSFPLGGEFSDQSRAWPGYGDFVQTVTRWLMGLDLPPGIGLRHRVDGTRLSVDLLYDAQLWNDKFAATPPRLRLLESATGAMSFEVPWKRIAPGHFSAVRDLDEGSMVRGAIQVGDHALPFGPVNIGSAVEWALDPERLNELRMISAQTGGRELLNLEEAWLRPPSEHERSLRLFLAMALLALVLVEALITRTGWRMPLPAMPRPKRIREKRKPVSKPKAAAAPEPDKPAEPAPPSTPPPATATERRSRFRRAKDKR
jgi:hypothetical protein